MDAADQGSSQQNVATRPILKPSRVAAAVVAAQLSACSLFSAPDIGELSFVNVEFISSVPDWAADVRDYMTYNPDAREARVTFASNVDWADLSGRFFSVSLHPSASLCPSGSAPELASGLDIYETYKERPVRVQDLGDAYRRYPDRERAQPNNGVYFYQVFFDALRKPYRPYGRSSYEPGLEPYDLVQSPKGVCFQISGGIYFGPKVTPKVFIVPEKAIEEAARRAPPPKAGAAGALPSLPSPSLPSPDIGDLELAGVEVISAAPHGPTAIRDYFIRNRDERLLKVTFTSKVDWAALKARSSPVYLHDEASLCPLSARNRLAVAGTIFETYQGWSVSVEELGKAYGQNPNRQRARPENGSYFYEVFFNPIRKQNTYGPPDQELVIEPFNLLERPQDICMQIFGGTSSGQRVMPKSIIVPSSAIEEAYRRAPPLAEHKL